MVEQKIENGFLVFTHPLAHNELRVPLEKPINEILFKIATYSGTPFECFHYGEEAENWFSSLGGSQVILTKTFEDIKITKLSTDHEVNYDF